MYKIAIACCISLLLAGSVSAQYKSVYTSVEEKNCKTLKSNADEAGSYVGECRGVSGYKLQVIEGDLRQSVNVIEPGGRKTELNLWNVSGGFSSIGETAEWRMKGKTPVALILRYNVSENPEDSSKITSYLVVIKLAKGSICITDALKPTRSHNAEARRAADNSAAKNCRFQ